MHVPDKVPPNLASDPLHALNGLRIVPSPGELTQPLDPLVPTRARSPSHSLPLVVLLVARRPSLERVENWVHASWRLSKPCLISLINKGHFIFRFNSQEDRDSIIDQSPFLFDKKKLLLLPWTPRQSEDSWPDITPVWIHL